MKNADELVGNPTHDNTRYCFVKANDVYLVYLPNGSTANLDLRSATGQFSVRWFDPRNGGTMKSGTVSTVVGGEENTSLGSAPDNPDEDWLVVVRRSSP